MTKLSSEIYIVHSFYSTNDLLYVKRSRKFWFLSSEPLKTVAQAIIPCDYIVTDDLTCVQVLITELSDHSGKVEDLKNILNQLITDNPDSPEAETWKRQLEDIGQ